MRRVRARSRISERASRQVFVAETLLLAVPISVLFLFFAPLWLISGALLVSFGDIANGCFAVVASFALVCGWVLIVSYLRGGRFALRQRSLGWWLVSALGVGLCVVAVLIDRLPPSEPYTPLWSFRQDFALFGFGWPLLVPFGHLVLERLAQPEH